MRFAAFLCLVATPVFGWEMAASEVCVLRHTTEEATLSITYDRRDYVPYSIEISQGEPWALAPMFSMRFDGPQQSVISTNRHQLSGDATALTVTDRGFGNVLAGLEFNFLATAKSGATVLYFPLAGAADAVRAFRACVASTKV